MTDKELINDISESLQLLGSLLPEVNEHLRNAQRLNMLLCKRQNAQSDKEAAVITGKQRLKIAS